MKQLKLVKNLNNIYKCRDKIQGDFPMYIPKIGNVAWKINYFQIKTLHGGVTLTMTAVRNQYWIQLTETVMAASFIT